MPTYPFDGCCEHGPNAHNRDRCLACPCTKPAVQVTPKAEKPVFDAMDQPDIRRCVMCKALHLDSDREAHLDWHEELIRQMHTALTGVSVLRTRIGDST